MAPGGNVPAGFNEKIAQARATTFWPLARWRWYHIYRLSRVARPFRKAFLYWL